MSRIQFVSHESFPEDEYTKELVYLCVDGTSRVAYVRKSSKSGGLFWSVASVGVVKNGHKEFFPAFMHDSNFLEKDIKTFLESRSWESRSIHQGQVTDPERYSAPKPTSMDQVSDYDRLPF